MMWEVISYNTRPLLVFLYGKVNSACYIPQVVNPVLLPFLRQESDELFQQENAHPYSAAATQCALCGVNQLPWPARSPDLSPIEHVWNMMKGETHLFPEAATTIAELRQRMQDAWDNLSQDDIRHLYGRFHARIHACVSSRGKYTTYCCDCLATAYCDMCVSFGVNFLSNTPIMINYLSHQFFNFEYYILYLYLKVLHLLW